MIACIPDIVENALTGGALAVLTLNLVFWAFVLRCIWAARRE